MIQEITYQVGGLTLQGTPLGIRVELLRLMHWFVSEFATPPQVSGTTDMRLLGIGTPLELHDPLDNSVDKAKS